MRAIRCKADVNEVFQDKNMGLLSPLKVAVMMRLIQQAVALIQHGALHEPACDDKNPPIIVAAKLTLTTGKPIHYHYRKQF